MGKRYQHKTKKKSPLPLIFAGTGLILIALAIIIFVPKNESTSDNSVETGWSPAMVNYPAPDLSLMDVTGNLASLTDYRGKIVLVNNWATWCPPCKAEMPDLEAYFSAHKDDGFTLIGISAGDTETQVNDFIQDYGITFPMWLDPYETALDSFNTMNLPSSFVIDETGTVRMAWSGAVSLENLEKYVTPLFKD